MIFSLGNESLQPVGRQAAWHPAKCRTQTSCVTAAVTPLCCLHCSEVVVDGGQRPRPLSSTTSLQCTSSMWLLLL
jgi:hypothetical protein